MILVPVHFVWSTWGRLPLITEEGERRLWRYIEATCRDLHCDVLAVGGMPDHVHLLVNLAPTLSLADLMKRVKGSSARFMSVELREGEWFRWQAHYGAFGVAPSGVDAVVRYIANQKTHHQAGALRPELERCDAEDDNDGAS
jgi:REP element-mobilizing transposase RayT